MVLIDYEGRIDGEPFEGGTARDYLLELGEGRVLPELEKALEGAEPGEERQATFISPTTTPPRRSPARPRSSRSRSRRSARRSCPTSTTTSLRRLPSSTPSAELRDHISEQIRQVLDRQIAERFREDALDAAVAQAKVEICPTRSIGARAEEMWRRVERQLGGRGWNPRTTCRFRARRVRR